MTRAIPPHAAALLLASTLLAGCSSEKPAEQARPATPPAQTAQAPPAPQPSGVQVLKWGPQSTSARKGFAVQPNGNSALWFDQRGIGSPAMIDMWFGEKKLDGIVITPNGISSVEVPPALIATAGRYPVYITLKGTGQRVDLGTFEVTAK